MQDDLAPARDASRPAPGGALDRRRFLKATAALALASSWPRAARVAAAASPPNVLLIMADQLRHDAVGYAGVQPALLTPNIDLLARFSQRYHDAYVQTPYCATSRSAIFSSRYPHANGVLENSAVGFPPPITGEVFPEVLHQHGWMTRYTGKKHVDVDITAYKPNASLLVPYADAQPLVLPDEHTGLWTSGYDDTATHQGDKTARRAMHFLDRYATSGEKRPFFLWVTFEDPHPLGNGASQQSPEAYQAPEGPEWTYADPTDIVVPALTPNEFANKPKVLADHVAGWHSPHGDLDHVRASSAHYFGGISMVDKHIGRVLRTLMMSGLSEDTLVIFLADHGDFMGAHDLYRKRNCCYDDITRIPLLVSRPGQMAQRFPGEDVRGFVESIDIGPWIYDFCNVPEPVGVQGDASQLPHDRVFCEVGTGPLRAQSIRTADHLYVEWPQDGELYELATDPAQVVNRFNDPTLVEVQAQLVAALELWRQQTAH